MSVYELSYQKKENYPYCSMMIVADDEKAVENYAIDKGYTWFAFSEIDTATVDENNRKNMPCIDLTPVDEKTAQMDAIHAEIMQEHEERVEKTLNYIQHGQYRLTCDLIERYLDEPINNEGLKRYSTSVRWSQYQNGEITRQRAVEYASKRYFKQAMKDLEKRIARMVRVFENDLPMEITVTVEWKRSSTWGHNPHVTANIDGVVYRGTASGCGYDKESTAIANAFNQSTAMLRLLYTLKASALLEGKKPGENNSNTPLCSYGAGYGALPYYEGGVGSNCFWSILKNCGYSTKYIDAGKYSTVYVINKKEG